MFFYRPGQRIDFTDNYIPANVKVALRRSQDARMAARGRLRCRQERRVVATMKSLDGRPGASSSESVRRARSWGIFAGEGLPGGEVISAMSGSC